MKDLVIWLLVTLLVSHCAPCAWAFDKEKLLTLKPLCSERIARQAADYENGRLWGSLGLGLLGLAVFSANSSGTTDNQRLGNMSVGLMFLTTGALMYITPGEPVIQNNTLQAMGLTGTEKEEAAYALLKSNAVKSSEGRKTAGLLLSATGLGWALLSSLATGATQSYKDNMNTGAATFVAVGLLAYLLPGPGEREMEEIDRTIARP